LTKPTVIEENSSASRHSNFTRTL